METPDSEGSGVQEDLQLTPQEERLLRSFFRRHALPYVVGAGAVVVLCLAFAFLRGDDRAPPAPLPEPGADAVAVGELRADLDRALADLAALGTRARERAGEAGLTAKALDQRLAAVFQRVEEVEDRADAAEASKLERLDGVEARLSEIEKVLAARRGDASQPPAAADPR